MEELERLRESIKQLLVEGRDERLSDLVEDAHPADVSRVIRELPRDDQVRLFRLLSPQHAGEVLAELDDPTLRELVGSLPEVEVSRVLDHMPSEQVVDVVEELPKERADEILELMEEEKSEEVQELLEYREGTAGRLMSPEFVAVREDATVAEAIEHIRKAASGEGAFYLYVVDHVTTGDGTPMAARVIHGALLAQMLDRTPPTISYWATLRVREYDELIPVS